MSLSFRKVVVSAFAAAISLSPAFADYYKWHEAAKDASVLNSENWRYSAGNANWRGDSDAVATQSPSASDSLLFWEWTERVEFPVEGMTVKELWFRKYAVKGNPILSIPADSVVTVSSAITTDTGAEGTVSGGGTVKPYAIKSKGRLVLTGEGTVVDCCGMEQNSAKNISGVVRIENYACLSNACIQSTSATDPQDFTVTGAGSMMKDVNIWYNNAGVPEGRWLHVLDGGTLSHVQFFSSRDMFSAIELSGGVWTNSTEVAAQRYFYCTNFSQLAISGTLALGATNVIAASAVTAATVSSRNYPGITRITDGAKVKTLSDWDVLSQNSDVRISGAGTTVDLAKSSFNANYGGGFRIGGGANTSSATNNTFTLTEGAKFIVRNAEGKSLEATNEGFFLGAASADNGNRFFIGEGAVFSNEFSTMIGRSMQNYGGASQAILSVSNATFYTRGNVQVTGGSNKSDGSYPSTNNTFLVADRAHAAIGGNVQFGARHSKTCGSGRLICDNATVSIAGTVYVPYAPACGADTIRIGGTAGCVTAKQLSLAANAAMNLIIDVPKQGRTAERACLVLTNSATNVESLPAASATSLALRIEGSRFGSGGVGLVTVSSSSKNALANLMALADTYDPAPFNAKRVKKCANGLSLFIGEDAAAGTYTLSIRDKMGLLLIIR